MKNVLQTVAVFFLLAASACAQSQIGQARAAGTETIVIGQGSLLMRGTPLKEQAVLTNVTTGDVLDIVLPSELITQLKGYDPATGTWTKLTNNWIYSVRHTVPVKKGDVIVEVIDGVPSRTYQVRESVFYGHTIWDIWPVKAP